MEIGCEVSLVYAEPIDSPLAVSHTESPADDVAATNLPSLLKATAQEQTLNYQNADIRAVVQDISRVTQQSLRHAISVVPQDISLFHRSILENVRYGRPEATDEENVAMARACDSSRILR